MKINLIKFFTKKNNKSKTLWSIKHLNDPYVKLSKKDKFESRAAYKLEEIMEKNRILKRGNLFLELGSSPGSWTQILREKNKNAKIICVDLIDMENDYNVDFLKCDIFKLDTKLKICDIAQGSKIDCLFSDFCTNFDGIKDYDNKKSFEMNMLILNYCINFLKNNGNLVMKTFDEGNYSKINYLGNLLFNKFKRLKPEASRKSSSEMYLVGLGYKPEIFDLLKKEEDNNLIIKKCIEMKLKDFILNDIEYLIKDYKEIILRNKNF